QDTLEHALSTVADAPIRVVASGRTDAGVHAEAQVVHFDTQVQRRQRAWLLGTNRYLPQDVAVLWIVPVTDGLHPRLGAPARTSPSLRLHRISPTALWRDCVRHSH